MDAPAIIALAALLGLIGFAAAIESRCGTSTDTFWEHLS